MSEPEEHQSIYPGGHKSWRPGVTCAECETKRAKNLERFPHRSQAGQPVPLVYADPRFSTNPKVEKFWGTGDPSVFAKPGALDYHGD